MHEQVTIVGTLGLTSWVLSLRQYGHFAVTSMPSRAGDAGHVIKNRQTPLLSIGLHEGFGDVSATPDVFLFSSFSAQQNIVQSYRGRHSRRNAAMPKRDDIHKILVIGSGPIVIGQAAE